MGALLLALLLAAGSFQCVTTCVNDECSAQTAPPCHQESRHQRNKTVQACPHEIVLDRTNHAPAPAMPPAVCGYSCFCSDPAGMDLVRPSSRGPAPPLIALRI